MNEDTQSASRRTIGNDNQPPPVDRVLMDMVMGWRFFSRLPSGSSDHEPPSLTRIAPILGPVSLLIGLGPALLIFLLALVGMPVLPATAFGIAALALVTGAMSEDAIADSFDGLWGGHDPARRLEIMHDSTQGTFGVLAIVGFFALRMSLLAALFVSSPVGGVMLWVAAQILARQASLWLSFRLATARSDGVGHAAGQLPARPFGTGLAVALVLFVVGVAPFVGFSGLLVSLIVAAGTALFWDRICVAKVGGYTGDLIGGLQALVEIGLLSTFILFR